MKTPSPTLLRIVHSGVVMLGLLTAIAAIAGQQELATSLGEARTDVVQARDQLQVTVNALDALAKQKSGDMRPAYDAFVSEIAKTESVAKTTVARVKKMQDEASAHFGSWQKEIDGISNANLKKKAQKRFDAVQKSYSKMTSQLGEAGARFNPLLSDMGDIQKTLVNDLTPGGVKSVRSSVSDAQWNLKSARRAIAGAIDELAKMENSLGTMAK